ncbi:hypothetical protein ACSS6W_008725 [Trichoderma asperelloides]
MAPEITSWEELLWVFEEFNNETEDFQCTAIAKVDDKKIFYSEKNKLKADITFKKSPPPSLEFLTTKSSHRGPNLFHQTASSRKV